jgi:O-antigen/teichoic acid export membrane protein
MLSGALIAINRGFNVIGFAYLYLFVSLVVFAYSFSISLWRFAKPAIKVDFTFWKPVIKEALPFGFSWLLFNLYYYADTVILSKMKGDAPVGWYNAAYRLIFFLLLTREILHKSIFPVMSNFFKTSKEALKLVCEKLFKYSMIIAIPIATGTTILAKRFISLVYGNDYFPSVIVLQILIWSFVVLLANFTPRLFEAINRQVLCTKIYAVGVVINITLNLILISRFSYIGAAITNFLTLFILLLISFVIFSRTEYKFGPSFLFKIISKIVIASTVMGLFVLYFYKLNLAILIIFSALIYTILIYLLKIFDEKDIHLFKRLIQAA